MLTAKNTLSWLGAAVAALSCAAALAAQTRTEAPPAGAPFDTLAVELRQLRLAVEELTRSQTLTQALGVYLSVQQSRMLQMS